MTKAERERGHKAKNVVRVVVEYDERGVYREKAPKLNKHHTNHPPANHYWSAYTSATTIRIATDGRAGVRSMPTII